MPVSKKTPAKKVVKEKKYDLTVRVNDQVLKTKTDNFEEALLALELKFIKTPVKIELKKGKKMVEKIIFPPEARRTFHNKNNVERLANQLNLLING